MQCENNEAEYVKNRFYLYKLLYAKNDEWLKT